MDKIESLKNEIHHLREELKKEAKRINEINFSIGGIVHDIYIAKTNVRLLYLKLDSSMHPNLSEEDAIDIKMNISNILSEIEQMELSKDSLCKYRDERRIKYDSCYKKFLNLKRELSEAKKDKNRKAKNDRLIEIAMAENLFIPDEKPRKAMGDTNADRIRNAYLCALKDYDYKRIDYCNKRDINGIYAMNYVINRLNRVWKDGEFHKYVKFSKSIIKGGRQPQYFYSVPNWVDNVVDKEIKNWFPWYLDSAYISRVIKHRKVERRYTDRLPIFDSAITGICGDYGKCFDVDPYGKDAESACYERMIEDTIMSFGSIGCQKI